MAAVERYYTNEDLENHARAALTAYSNARRNNSTLRKGDLELLIALLFRLNESEGKNFESTLRGVFSRLSELSEDEL